MQKHKNLIEEQNDQLDEITDVIYRSIITMVDC